MNTTPAPTSVTPYLFVVRGDLTRIQADVIVYSTSTRRRAHGDLTRAMHAHVPGFERAWQTLAPALRLELGHVDWIELGPDAAPRRAVIAAVTVDDSVTAEAVERVVERAIELAWLRLLASEPHRRRILVALPSLGTGTSGTGRQRAAELARVQTRALARALARPRYEGRVDAVVVAYSKAAYRRFIEARAALRPDHAWLEPPEVIDEARPLVSAIQRRECVLFVGSGLSIGAGLSSWNELVARLVGDVPGLADFLRARAMASMPDALRRKLPPDWLPPLSLDDFLDLAQWHEQSDHQGATHRDYIHELFGRLAVGQPPTLAHYLLLSLPFATIVTTNYDNLIEDTLDALRTPRQRVVTDAEVPLVGDSTAVSVVKLHGHAMAHVERLEPEARARYDEAIVLTRDEYDQFFERHPAKARLLEALLLSHHFCFYGYSLSDPDLRQIYNRAARMLHGTRRTAWSITPFEASPWSRRQWAAKGLHQIGFQPHHTRGDEFRQLMLWLDHLAEVAAEHDQTFLESVDAPTRDRVALAPLHAALHEVGHALETLCAPDHPLTADEVELLEPILELLEHLGWQSRGANNAQLWERMAEIVATDGQSPGAPQRHARRLLHRALGSADRLETMERALRSLALLARS